MALVAPGMETCGVMACSQSVEKATVRHEPPSIGEKERAPGCLRPVVRRPSKEFIMFLLLWDTRRPDVE